MSNEHVVSMKEHCLNVIEEVFEPAMDWLFDTVMSTNFRTISKSSTVRSLVHTSFQSPSVV